VVAQVALRHPARVAGLVLVAPQIGGVANEEDAGNPLANPALPALATIFLQSLNPISIWAEAELRAYFKDTRLRDFLQAQLGIADVSDAMASAEARFTRVRGWEAGLRAFGQAVLADRAPLRAGALSAMPRIPILIMWGEADAFIPVGQGRQLQKALPTSALIIYPRAGHQPWRDLPEAFAHDLLAFLSRLS
jgi:pimeloyl-ACP methyl ester carboxylesterase